MAAWVLTLVLLLIGLALIVKGGDIFVDAATWMAEISGIPKFIIGATVVSLATTLPEMIVSFLAAGQGKVDMAIGNAVGSVTANTGLIMGIALIFLPHAISRKDLFPKAALMLGAAGIIFIFGLRGQLGILPNILLTILFFVALWDNITCARRAVSPRGSKGVCATLPVNNPSVKKGDTPSPKPLNKQIPINIIKFMLGTIAIVVGAELLVDNGSELALLLGVPERIIAVSVIAIGTSLPELVTTISAIAKKQSSLSIGNILGANIIDLAIILPVSSLLAKKALPVSPQFAYLDLPACLIIGIIALLPALITKKFTRVQGVIMVAAYLAYILYSTLFMA